MDYKALRGSQRSAAQKYAAGGAVHDDAAQDKVLINKAIRDYAAKDKKQDAAMDDDDGMKRGGRLDKKPRSPKKESVKVNIINAPRDPADPMAAMKSARAMPAPQALPAAMPTRMPPMRKCGGRT